MSTTYLAAVGFESRNQATALKALRVDCRRLELSQPLLHCQGVALQRGDVCPGAVAVCGGGGAALCACVCMCVCVCEGGMVR